MRYNFSIIKDEYKERLDSILKREYEFRLLNFASVVADVLAENTIFSKKIGGKEKSEIRNEIKKLEGIKQKLLKELTDYFFHYHLKNCPEFIIKELKESVDEKGPKFYISIFKLESFFSELDSRIEELKEALALYQYNPEFLKEIIPFPICEGYPRPINYTNQICFLWAFAMRDKDGRSVSWEKASELIDWFIYHLKFSEYVDNIKPIPRGKYSKEIESLKTFFRRIKRKFPTLLKITGNRDYFPNWASKAQKPFFLKKVKNGGLRVFPVVAIKFYKNKIKTIFKENNNLKVRETVFEKNKFTSEIRDYYQKEEKLDGENLLLEID